MPHNIPAEIFHRIIWDSLLLPSSYQSTLPHRYHLQEDRQVRFYTLPDFQNARLVCRQWNQWLLNDFECWRHLCIQGSKSLEIARDVIERFPGRPFQIRIRVRPNDEDVRFDEFEDSEDEDEDELALGRFLGLDQLSDGSLDSGSGAGWSVGEANTSYRRDDENPLNSGDDVAEEDLVGGESDEDSLLSDEVTYSEREGLEDILDRVLEDTDVVEDVESDPDSNLVRLLRAGPNSSLNTTHDRSWIPEAIELLTPISRSCDGLFLHMPTQMIHSALRKWTESGAPNLRQCLIEAIDYDGRRGWDLQRFRFTAEAEQQRPPTPPLGAFLAHSPTLESIMLVNYYVPVSSPQNSELATRPGFDVTRVRECAMICDRRDALMISPSKADVVRHLLQRAAENGCQSLTLELAVDDVSFYSSQLRVSSTLENLTLCQTRLKVNLNEPGPVPTHGDPAFTSPSDCHIKNFTLRDVEIVLGRVRGIPKQGDELQLLLDDMPELESLSLIQTTFVRAFPPAIVNDHFNNHFNNFNPGAYYIPPDTPLPQLTTLLLENTPFSPLSMTSILKRAINLVNLTLTWRVDPNVKSVLQALRTISGSSNSVLCPHLKRLRILYPRLHGGEMDPIPWFRLSRAISKLEIKRSSWAAKGRCESLEVTCTSLEDFRSTFYGSTTW
ncbi:hypothetical protein SISNIDRAFT_489622 [Sistotremastrum niveocremeum HHB9708]|uniref:F-box domain-containing protein n=1 Tax=Sistotremastrum niveocremeum HHB9708 TaxID=1314777 RepID=A0A164PRA2_9AGAM|nr:hypothetical protein SISNIDRAFT_489622 [Sistotremastrum niveocremeum HHB9708]